MGPSSDRVRTTSFATPVTNGNGQVSRRHAAFTRAAAWVTKARSREQTAATTVATLPKPAERTSLVLHSELADPVADAKGSHYNDAYRPHQSFGGRTPAEVYEGRERADQRTGTGSTGRLTSGRQVALDVSYLEGRQHLPIVELMPAA